MPSLLGRRRLRCLSSCPLPLYIIQNCLLLLLHVLRPHPRGQTPVLTFSLQLAHVVFMGHLADVGDGSFAFGLYPVSLFGQSPSKVLLHMLPGIVEHGTQVLLDLLSQTNLPFFVWLKIRLWDRRHEAG